MWPWPPPDTTDWTPQDWATARARYWGTWPWCGGYPDPGLWSDLPARRNVPNDSAEPPPDATPAPATPPLSGHPGPV